jgi:hypothetical protein
MMKFRAAQTCMDYASVQGLGVRRIEVSQQSYFMKSLSEPLRLICEFSVERLHSWSGGGNHTCRK